MIGDNTGKHQYLVSFTAPAFPCPVDTHDKQMNTVVVFIIIGNFCYEFYPVDSRNFREELDIYSNIVLNLFRLFFRNTFSSQSSYVILLTRYTFNRALVSLITLIRSKATLVRTEISQGKRAIARFEECYVRIRIKRAIVIHLKHGTGGSFRENYAMHR